MSQSKVMNVKVADQLLQLQQLFHSRFLTAELLNQLIATYVQAIQCFDGGQSAMRKYFLNKIQFVLSRPEIDGMLQRANQKNDMAGMLRQTIRMTTANHNSQDPFSEKMVMQAIEADCKKSRQMHQNSQQTEENKLKERKAKIQMQLQMMKEVEQNMKNIKEQVQQIDKKNMHKKKKINALVEAQNTNLEDRLARRKKKRKKSVDQLEIREMQVDQPLIKKEELKQAQKDIQAAVIRFTIRMTERNLMGTGLLKNNSSGSENVRRIKMKNEDEDEGQEPIVMNPQSMKKKTPKQTFQSINQVEQTKPTPAKDNPEQKQPGDRMTGTFGGKGRITGRRNQEEDEQDLMNDDCF